MISHIQSLNLADKLSERMQLILLSGDKIPINLSDRIRAFFPNVGIISLGVATE